MELDKMLEILARMEKPKHIIVKEEHTFTEQEVNDENLFIRQVAKEFKKAIPDLKVNTSKEDFFTCTFGGSQMDVSTQNEYLKSKTSIECKGCHRARLDDIRSYHETKYITCVGMILRKLNNR